MEWLSGMESRSRALALLDVGLRELPPVYCDGMGFWLRGLVLMERVGGVGGWCRCERDGRGVMRVLRDYCDPVREVVGVLRVHPYEYLDDVRWRVAYRDAVHCRRYLEMFFVGRMERLVGSGGLSSSAACRLRAYTDGRVCLCRSSSVSDLGWLDRERMILCQREEVSRVVMDGVQVVEPEVASYGVEARSSGVLSGALPVVAPRRRGRPAGSGRPSRKG